ncbi:MAG: 3-dehydroquinate synthase [Magnetococcales bacterium]|nr:3-dehydroquinate synthase [Magnetococcales bacterium]
MTRTTILPLDLGERSYEIHIGSGLLDHLGTDLRPLARGRQVAVVTNDTVAPLYLERVTTSLAGAGFSVLSIELPDGEDHKDWTTLNRIFDALIAQRCERTTLLVALGGGVVGDMTGFAAAAFLRGVDFVQVPTTLLSQVDASVGGKTGINHPLGKNLIGAFHQPRRVIIDVTTLATLPRREILAGLAEVIKHGLLRDADLFQHIEEHLDALLALDPAMLVPVIRDCCAIKARVVSADERESGQRALLNLGHTFGHAIETLAGYGNWLHGEAVGMGMILAADLSRRLGLCADAVPQRVIRLIERSGLPTRAPRHPPQAYLDAMGRDKKVEGGQVRFVLLERIGQAVLRKGVDPALVAATVADHLAD